MTAVERVFAFGPDLGLMGILTEPEGLERREGAPMFLMWNVGLTHRVGPFRFFVNLSRALADAGFASLRFDVSGLGDSEVAREDRRRDAERAEGDVRVAMQALTEKTGCDRFVLVGFCSGVDAAHALARRERQVVGAVFLEGYAYRTRGSARRYPKRLLDLHRWERFFRLHFPRAFGESARWSDAVSEREMVYLREYPTSERFGAEVRQIAEKGTYMLFIYVAGDSSYSYREQLFEYTGRGAFDAQIEIEFYADADHTFYLPEHRRRTLSRIVVWATSHFEGKGTAERHSYERLVAERKTG